MYDSTRSRTSPHPSRRPHRHRSRRQRRLVRAGLLRQPPDGCPTRGGHGPHPHRSRWTLAFALHVHDTNQNEIFAETTTGLDHVGFVLRPRADLERWQDHLERHGVVRAEAADKPLTQSPISDQPYGSVLVFRDPDNIQLETLHPAAH